MPFPIPRRKKNHNLTFQNSPTQPIWTSMAEAISPNPIPGQKDKVPMSARNRIQSPTSTFVLGSNDDQLERAQARAARAAAIRQKSLAAKFHSQHMDRHSGPCLNKQQILDLFHNCVKLASENVIKSYSTFFFFYC